MLTINNMTKWQAFMWLWKFDSEEKFSWLKYFLLGHDLKDDVKINLCDFGISKRVCWFDLQRDKLNHATRLEF